MASLNFEENLRHNFHRRTLCLGEICTVRCAAEDEANKRRLLDIDLNATPEEDDSPSTAVDKVTEGESSECRLNCGWEALIKVAEVALIEYEEKFGRKKVENQKTTEDRCGGDGEVAAVVKSKRGRTVALPTKYRDSYFWELSGKSVAAVSTARRRIQ